MKKSKEFYVVKPILPDFDNFSRDLKGIWDSKILSNCGPIHNSLESDLKDYLDVDNLSLFNNGTIALLIALKSLDLSGTVLTTPFTFSASVHTLYWNNLTPIFCDVEKDTLNIDPYKMESLIQEDTSAILAVHVYGNPCNVYEIEKIAKKYNLKVIYDSAHAFGVKINNKSIGNFGDISMFSFHPTKLFHTAEGGALTTSSKELKEKIDFLRNFGMNGYDNIALPGINGKLNEIQSLLGKHILPMVEGAILQKRKLFDIYFSLLKRVPGIEFIYNRKSNVKWNYQYCIIKIDKDSFGISRDELHLKLQKENIFTRKYFHPLCSTYDWYKDLESSKNLPIAENASNSVLCLPLYTDLTQNDIIYICDTIIKSR